MDSPRMATMKKHADGFKIAETDLKLRGPGDFFGAMQHGLMPFKIANIYYDADILKECVDCAKTLLADDPKLTNPKNQPIKDTILRIFDTNITFA